MTKKKIVDEILHEFYNKPQYILWDKCKCENCRDYRRRRKFAFRIIQETRDECEKEIIEKIKNNQNGEFMALHELITEQMIDRIREDVLKKHEWLNIHNQTNRWIKVDDVLKILDKEEK